MGITSGPKYQQYDQSYVIACSFGELFGITYVVNATFVNLISDYPISEHVKTSLVLNCCSCVLTFIVVDSFVTNTLVCFSLVHHSLEITYGKEFFPFCIDTKKSLCNH